MSILEAWRLGIEGSGRLSRRLQTHATAEHQAESKATGQHEGTADAKPVEYRPMRRRLPDERAR